MLFRSQVACALQLPLSQVYGVASFYHLFSRTPPAAHRCALCMGTACVVNGASRLRQALAALIAAESAAPAWGLGEAAGAAGVATAALAAGDKPGAWRLESSGCLGACGDAPVLRIDGGPALRVPLDPPESLPGRLVRLGLPLMADRAED